MMWNQDAFLFFYFTNGCKGHEKDEVATLEFEMKGQRLNIILISKFD